MKKLDTSVLKASNAGNQYSVETACLSEISCYDDCLDGQRFTCVVCGAQIIVTVIAFSSIKTEPCVGT